MDVTDWQVLLLLFVVAVVAFLAGWLVRWMFPPGRFTGIDDGPALHAAPVTEALVANTPAPLTIADLPEITVSAAEAKVAVTERFAATASAARDDLKRIHGVGPAIEEMLSDMNIRTYRQVASFDANDIATVSAALSAFPDRILRDDWMAGARSEHREKYGEEL